MPQQLANLGQRCSVAEHLGRQAVSELMTALAGRIDFGPSQGVRNHGSDRAGTFERNGLERTAGWFSQDPSSKLIIEGHTDQRGTQAYNMVLAKKRAVAVQEYLSQLGVEASRLAIISYGKDKPFCQEATEVCHQLNRRGHLLVQNP
jgi:flagellar motor protein MotB